MAIFTIDYSSECLNRRYTFTAILPCDTLNSPAYRDATPVKYKTLYLLHGFSGDYTDWLTHCNTKNWASKYNCAVIMPSGENSQYLDLPFGYNKYGTLIGEELVRMSRKMLPLSDKREDTFIAGLSMGGFGALRNGLKYNDTFSHVCAFSAGVSRFEYPIDDPRRNPINDSALGDLKAAFESDMNPRVVVKNNIANNKVNQKIWISCGSTDDLYGANVGFRDFLIESGYDVTWDELPLAHEWAFWCDQLEKIGQWLPLKNGGKDNISRLDR